MPLSVLIRAVVRTLSRLLLVVILLLPAMLTGTLLEVPGGGCVSHSCCRLVHCTPHAHGMHAGDTVCNEHHHPHHCYVRLQLLREDAPRLHGPLVASVFPAQPVNDSAVITAGQWLPLFMLSRYIPPEHTIYLNSRRC